MNGSKKYENVKEGRRAIFINNFIGGIAWALGATVGVSLLLGILTLVVKQVNVIPFFGSFVSQVASYAFHNNPNFR